MSTRTKDRRSTAPLWATVAVLAVGLGIGLTVLGAISLSRPELRCDQAVAVVDRAGNPVGDETRCIAAVPEPRALDSGVAPLLLGPGAFLTVWGVLILASLVLAHQLAPRSDPAPGRWA